MVPSAVGRLGHPLFCTPRVLQFSGTLELNEDEEELKRILEESEFGETGFAKVEGALKLPKDNWELAYYAARPSGVTNASPSAQLTLNSILTMMIKSQWRLTPVWFPVTRNLLKTENGFCASLEYTDGLLVEFCPPPSIPARATVDGNPKGVDGEIRHVKLELAFLPVDKDDRSDVKHIRTVCSLSWDGSGQSLMSPRTTETLRQELRLFGVGTATPVIAFFLSSEPKQGNTMEQSIVSAAGQKLSVLIVFGRKSGGHYPNARFGLSSSRSDPAMLFEHQDAVLNGADLDRPSWSEEDLKLVTGSEFSQSITLKVDEHEGGDTGRFKCDVQPKYWARVIELDGQLQFRDVLHTGGERVHI